jgi:hypothetical protein
MLQTSQKQTVNKMTLWNFVTASKQNLGTDQALHLQRHMQKGVFAELWSRALTLNPELAVQRYVNLGFLTEALFQGNSSAVVVRDRIMAKPFFGILRSKLEYQDDIRFIVISHSRMIYILFDNPAIDNKMPTVMVLDKSLGTFVDQGQSLLEFCLLRDLKI